MKRAAFIALAALSLFGCGKRDPHYAATTPGLVYRRNDVAFTPRVASPADNTLALSRRIDAITSLMDQGLFEQAQKRLDEFFAAGETHPRAHFLQGRLFERRGEFEPAIPWFQKAVESSPRWAEPRVHLAQCYYKLNRLVAAEGVFDEIDRLAPQGPWGPYGKGVVANRRGDSARAIMLLDEALAREPRHAPSLRARAELAKGADEAALKENLLRRYLAEEPRDADAHFQLGELAAADGKAVEARRSFLASYDLDSQPATARRLAELALQRGDRAEAKLWQERAGIVDDKAVPDSPSAQ